MVLKKGIFAQSDQWIECKLSLKNPSDQAQYIIKSLENCLDEITDLQVIKMINEFLNQNNFTKGYEYAISKKKTIKN